MATRLYYLNTRSSVTVVQDSGWEAGDITNAAARKSMLGTDKSVSPSEVAPGAVVGSGVNPNDAVVAQFQSAPLSAQTISGTIKGQIEAQENLATLDCSSQMVIAVYSSDGLTRRGYLYTGTAAALSSEWTTPFANRKFPLAATSPVTLASVAASQGDILVVEVGGRIRSTNTASGIGLRWGGTGVDLPEDETTTTTGRAAWIEFSATLSFFVSGSFSLNAVLKRTQTGTFALDSVLKRNQTGSFSLNAVLKRNQTGSFALDSVLKRSQAGTFSLDAVIKRTQVGTFSLDAVLKRSQTGTLSLDSVLKRSQAGTFSLNAILRRTSLGLPRQLSVDSFNADAPDLRTHVPDVGPVWLPMAPLADLRDWLIVPSGGGTGFLEPVTVAPERAYMDVGSSDVQVSAYVIPDAPEGQGVFLRAADQNNYWSLLGGGGTWSLTKVVGGAGVPMGDIFGAGAGMVVLSAFGDVITVTAPNGQSLSVVDAALRGNTLIGLSLYSESYGPPDVLSWRALAPATLDAVLKRTQVGTFALSAVLAGRLSLDAVLKQTQSGSFGLNAVLKRTQSFPTTVSLDTFTDANGTALNLHVPDVGPAWGGVDPSSSFGDWLIQSNQLTRTPNTLRYAWMEIGVTDVRLSLDLAHVENTPSIFVRYENPGSAWELYYDFGLSAWVLDRIESSVDHPLVPLDGPTTGTIVLSARGDEITAISPSGVQAVVASTFNDTRTKIAVALRGLSGVASTVDNWLAQTNVLALDAVLKRVQTGTFSLDAVLRHARAGSFSLDAILLRNQAGTLALDAVLKRGQVSSFTLDAVLRGARSGSLSLDAILRVAGAATFALDAVLRATGTSLFSLDAIARATGTGSFALDAIRRRTVSTSAAGGGVLGQDVLGGFVLGSVRQAPAPFALDSIIIATRSGSLAFDAVIRVPSTGSFSLAAKIAGAGVEDFALDAVLLAPHVATFSLAAAIATPVSTSFSLDAIARRAISAGTVFDAIVRQPVAGSFTLAAVIPETTFASFGVDAVLRVVASATFPLSAVVRATAQSPTALDAVIEQTRIGSFTLGAWLQVTRMVGVNLDAVLLSHPASAFSLSSVTRRASTGSFALEALRRITVPGSFALDAWFFARITVGVAFNAVVLRTGNTGSFGLSAIVTVTRPAFLGQTLTPLLLTATVDEPAHLAADLAVAMLAATVDEPQLELDQSLTSEALSFEIGSLPSTTKQASFGLEAVIA